MKPKPKPGEFPYTRGIRAEPRPWVMGQYAGFGTPAQSNERFRRLLDAGVTGFSVALDLPTQLGLDSDDPRAAGEVGRVGVAIDSLDDIEKLMDGIPLEKITQVRTTANSIGYLWTALFTALAERQGRDPGEFGLFIQNDGGGPVRGADRGRHPGPGDRGAVPDQRPVRGVRGGAGRGRRPGGGDRRGPVLRAAGGAAGDGGAAGGGEVRPGAG